MLRSADCARVKAFIGDSLDAVKSSKSNPLTAAAVQRAVVMKELIASQPLLHCCVGEPSSRTADNRVIKSTVEGRIAVAQYLLGLKSHPISLSVRDDDGRTALHLAAKKEDSHMLKLLLAAREESAERRAQLDINARCGKSGWTFLHYAAGQGDVSAVKLLIEAGAIVVVHALVGKAVTPLDLVKTRLQNAGHFSAAHIANLQQVAKELSEAVRALEKVKAQKEAERLLKEEKVEEARKKLVEKEEKEKELLERKQRQLKEKQDRARELEEELGKKSMKSIANVSTVSTSKGVVNSAIAVTPSPTTSFVGTSSISLVVPTGITVSSMSSPIGGEIIDLESNMKIGKKKKKKDKKLDSEETLQPPIPANSDQNSSAGKVTVVDVASRDELVDHLLAMGFAESDCLSAISLYGKDLDRALSWLCDRPADSANKDSNSHGVKSSSISIQNNNNSNKQSGNSASTSSSNSDSSSSSQIENIRLQKEKDHKEELRRVNRAWNLKNEDEKKRVSKCSFIINEFCISLYF